MERAQVRERVESIARDTLRLEGPLPDGDLADHLDSMELLSLVVAIEDAFQISFEPEDEAVARTLDDVIDVILAKKVPGA